MVVILAAVRLVVGRIVVVDVVVVRRHALPGLPQPEAAQLRVLLHPVPPAVVVAERLGPGVIGLHGLPEPEHGRLQVLADAPWQFEPSWSISAPDFSSRHSAARSASSVDPDRSSTSHAARPGPHPSVLVRTETTY